MKRIIYLLMGAMLLLSSCFEDEGNYEYKNLNPPHWVQDFSTSPARFMGYEGGDVTFTGSRMFIWDENPEERANEVRYEWVFNNNVVSTELDFTMPVKEFMEKSGIKEFSNNNSGPSVGSFHVIEKETGITFIAKVLISLKSFYTGNRDWFILADDNGKTNIASFRDRPIIGKPERERILIDHAYEHHNSNQSIPGKPVSMNLSFSPHVGSQGALTILTDQVAYELNAENLTYFGDLKEAFMDGAPADFRPIIRADIDRSGGNQPCTFLVNHDGKIYTRIMSPNYLGGKFLSEPYVIDSKGYDIEFFGKGLFAGAIPCYDKKNRRVIMSHVWRVDINEGGGMGDGYSAYRINMRALSEKTRVPVAGFPEGAEVIAVNATRHMMDYNIPNTGGLFTAFYTLPDKPGKTMVGDFIVDLSSMRARDVQDYLDKSVVLDKQLTKDSQIATCGNQTVWASRFRDYYSIGNNLYCIKRDDTGWYNTVQDLHVAVMPAKITSIVIDNFTYDRMFVGLENGQVFLCDIYETYPKPIWRGQVSGKVIGFKQLTMRSGSDDNF